VANVISTNCLPTSDLSYTENFHRKNYFRRLLLNVKIS